MNKIFPRYYNNSQQRTSTESFHLVFNHSTKSKMSCTFLTVSDCSRSLETHVTCEHLCLSNAVGINYFLRNIATTATKMFGSLEENRRINSKNNCKFIVSTKKRKKYFHELDNILAIKLCHPIIRYHREP